VTARAGEAARARRAVEALERHRAAWEDARRRRLERAAEADADDRGAAGAAPRDGAG
jgi:hypothetical protein